MRIRRMGEQHTTTRRAYRHSTIRWSDALNDRRREAHATWDEVIELGVQAVERRALERARDLLAAQTDQ